ncbi:ceramide glucosyltransferase-B-like [Rhopilema esculentum]|uniref:ceramide glucosyltransferase-B-like n=1 Tax=Rhopilema esculentum TaxID=499914 RepID=UPI0031DEB24E
MLVKLFLKMYYDVSTLDIVAFLCIAGWLFMMFVHLVAIIYGKIHLYSWGNSTNLDELPGVTILKPVVGDDANSYKNFQSFFELEYPKYEILFCFQNDHDPAIATIEKLLGAYPKADAKIFRCALNVGVNPKVNNMMQGYNVAKYNLIWISDSSLKVTPNTLQEMVSHMKQKVAVVHQLPFITNGDGFGESLEKVYFGTQHARVYLFTNCMQLQCVNGMSSLINKTALEEIGGLRSLSDYIAEDYYMCKEFYKRGYKLVLSTLPALQNPEVRTVAKFRDRMVRWTRLRLTMEPFPQCLEPLTECFVIGLCMALAVNYFTNRSIIFSFAQHCLIWFVSDQILLRIVQGPNGPLPSLLRRSLVWLFRETCTYFLYLQGLFGRSVAWRTRKFKLSVGGKAKAVNHNSYND